MKEINKAAWQGDVLIRKVKELPSTAVKKNDKIVTHSETGHHHVAVGNVAVYEIPGSTLTGYIEASEDFEIQHLRSFDTHETLKMLCKGPTVFEIKRQREHTPEGWQRVAD